MRRRDFLALGSAGLAFGAMAPAAASVPAGFKVTYFNVRAAGARVRAT